MKDLSFSMDELETLLKRMREGEEYLSRLIVLKKLQAFQEEKEKVRT